MCSHTPVSYTHLDVYKRQISVLFSHLSSKNIESARLSWKIEGTDIKGEKPISKVQRGLNEIENIEFSLPEVIEPKTFKLILKLTSKRRIIAENYVNIFVVPKNILKYTDYKIGLAENSIPVSYTHLDVYKRQESSSSIIKNLLVYLSSSFSASFLKNLAQKE